MSARSTIRFDSYGTECDAWFFTSDAASPFDRQAGRPVVVMAHGFGGTKDSGLEPFARRLAAAGLAVFAFDYRGFGASDGTPRQRIHLAGQLEDYRSAIAAAGKQAGVDRSRVVLWGISQSGGHVLVLAAERADVCAAISVAPMVSGLSAGRHALAQHGPVAMASSTVAGVRNALATRLGAAPTMLPLVGKPGERAALTAEGYYESYLALAGPTWRNEVDASVGLEIGGYRADRHADRITAPVLVQIADVDRAAPPQAAAKAAFAARAEVRHYPCDHFDVFAGNDWFEPTVDDQIRFLTRKLLGTTHADVAPSTQQAAHLSTAGTPTERTATGGV
ncbi:alpha/beta hydrolase [Nocardia shimofusensis]|uniref:alpha/beta hydrolase n=1 Tax=Nocardia shimofusensis TaxID=228596 RepID=UPI00082A050E|nr:alpha/beta fold hydrolase [Nocardia shimofusensis]